MNNVTLLPNSARLKQLIKEHGPIWEVLDSEPKELQCFNNDLGLMISTRDGMHLRNVRLTDIKESL